MKSGTWRLLTLLGLLASLGGCAKQDVDFTGIWKTDCANYFGVQIRPDVAGLYIVTFCGLTGCIPPGEWMPNTRIAGDPLYEVVSSTTLRIKRNDTGTFTYRKCTADSSWPTRPG